LIKHIKIASQRNEAASGKKNLLAGADDSSAEEESGEAEPIWLVLTTKKHIVDQKRLKPGRISLPHPIHKSGTSTICLITPDPQRTFKNVIADPSFPPELASRIRVLGIEKLKGRYKSYESKRQLVAQYDIFLADDRVVTLLPKLLGKTMYESTTKRAIPVKLDGYKEKDAAGKRTKDADSKKDNETKTVRVSSPAQVAKEIEKALQSAQVYLAPGTTTSIRVGMSNFAAADLAENIDAVVLGMEQKFVPKGWRNIRSIHIKAPNSMALPIWLADELWVKEDDVLEQHEAEEAKAAASQKGRKRKGREDEQEGVSKNKKNKKIESEGFSKEMEERREKLRAAKEEERKAIAAPEQGSAKTKKVKTPKVVKASA
jgi:ribosome biogenesis protein UTP30